MKAYVDSPRAERWVNRPIPALTALRAATRYTMDESGCWISTYTPGPTGYVSVAWRAGGQSYGSNAHRAAWTHHNGPIPDGMTVDHICKTRACVNPAHLRLLSHEDNSARKGRDWPVGECAWGHDLSEMRSHVWGGVERTACGACMKERNDYLTILRQQTRLLEIAYGLGDWSTKRTYAGAVREREARIAAVHAEREGLAA